MSKRAKQDAAKDASKPKVSVSRRSWSPKAGKNRTAEGRTVSPRKQARIDAQREREETNRRLRAKNLPTAWEEAKAARRARRAEQRANGLLPTQDRHNGRIVKKLDGGKIVLVQCCRNCDRAALPDPEPQPRRRRARAGSRR